MNKKILTETDIRFQVHHSGALRTGGSGMEFDDSSPGGSLFYQRPRRRKGKPIRIEKFDEEKA